MPSTEVFVHRSRMPAAAEAAFDWHTQPGALALLTPPWEAVAVLEEGAIEVGATTTLRIAIGPFSVRWVARIVHVEAGREFRDRQISGPFRSWEHAHRMEPEGADSSALEDRVSFALPGGWLAHAVAGWLVRRKLRRMFGYRHRVTAAALAVRAGARVTPDDRPCPALPSPAATPVPPPAARRTP